MSLRLQYWTVAPELNQALGQLSARIAAGDLESSLLHLVYLRVSQINDCAFCVDLHYRQALSEDEDPRRLNGIAVWRETTFFTLRERAALAWAESLTRIEQTGAPDDVFAEVREQFNDREVTQLSFAIAEMNAWNRVAVGFRRGPPALSS